jgi:hypothetical protein
MANGVSVCAADVSIPGSTVNNAAPAAGAYQRPAFLQPEDASNGEAVKMNKGAAGLLVIQSSRDTTFRARVSKVVTGDTTDIVLLEGGYRQGISPGMVLHIEQEPGRPVAALVVADATVDYAAALILEVAPSATIKAGDSAKIKTIHFN